MAEVCRHSDAININMFVSDMSVWFKRGQMADRLSLEGFRNYVFDRYNGSHGRSAYGVHDMINVPRSELRRYNRTFGWNQWLRIVFRYADDGRTLVGFHAMVITDFL